MGNKLGSSTFGQIGKTALTTEFLTAANTLLIVKEDTENTVKTFRGSEVKITKRMRHLAAVIESEAYKTLFHWRVRILKQLFQLDLQENWLDLWELLRIRENYWNYYKNICFTFMPTITGDHTCCHHDPKLFSHPARFGGLSIPTVHEIAFFDCKNSR